MLRSPAERIQGDASIHHIGNRNVTFRRQDCSLLCLVDSVEAGVSAHGRCSQDPHWKFQPQVDASRGWVGGPVRAPEPHQTVLK